MGADPGEEDFSPQLVIHVDVKGTDDEAGAAIAALRGQRRDPLRRGWVDDALRDQEEVRVRKDAPVSLNPRQAKIAELRERELGRPLREQRSVRQNRQGPGSQALQARMHPLDGRRGDRNSQKGPQ